MWWLPHLVKCGVTSSATKIWCDSSPCKLARANFCAVCHSDEPWSRDCKPRQLNTKSDKMCNCPLSHNFFSWPLSNIALSERHHSWLLSETHILICWKYYSVSKFPVKEIHNREIQRLQFRNSKNYGRENLGNSDSTSPTTWIRCNFTKPFHFSLRRKSLRKRETLNLFLKRFFEKMSLKYYNLMTYLKSTTKMS